MSLKKRAAAAAPSTQEPTKPKPTATKAPTLTHTALVPTTAINTTKTTVQTTGILTTPIIPTSTQSEVNSSPSTVPSAGSSNELNPAQTPSNTNHTGLIAGVAAGAFVLLVLFAGLLFRARRKRVREAREAREAEKYQQRTMMLKSSEGSSAMGYGDDSDFPLQQHQHQEQQQQRYQEHLGLLMSKQPEWFAKKSPLEYYIQVPPLEELRRLQQEAQQEKQQEQAQTREQQQQQRPYPLTQELSNTSSNGSSSSNGSASSSNPFAQNGASFAARSLTPSKADPSHTGELIALGPTNIGNNFSMPSMIRPGYNHQQYQRPRISTQGLRRPSSPVVSPSSSLSPTVNNPVSPYRTISPSTTVYSAISPTVVSPMVVSPTLPSQGSRPLKNSDLYSYTPPPPSTGPFTPTSPSSAPSPGFYDLLDDSEMLGRGDSKASSASMVSPVAVKARTTSATPPPIPRATRPISVASASSFKLTWMDMKADASAPAVPTVPGGL
ncbi:hypothetical protein BC939DRAFT_103904 [Gamsiella multidivaricata]|uniref:uncharacterized protein n=1 Tax=Gamsiella multidivaricata TaxID=101098 RepID=UPI00222079BE|nr:uncharacterized protein BC939DRAFT_103904 [Gamsiella multidivaricata]KAG0360207.1 hypothetical protein BGZ54_009656 [Gamsiella multidivaricata]KAI7832439.1 hypothetical protein BC939DRAFT_103904 [Gamsiella multidivaricata]